MVDAVAGVDGSESYCLNIEQVVHVVSAVVVVSGWFVKKVSESGFVMVN
jgi:hypothetical protein